jgi:hypothetical protein
LYDQSGNGGGVSQSNTSKQPTLTLNGYNGKPVLHFNTQQFLSNAINYPSPFTAIYGARQTGGARQRVLSSVYNNWLLGYWNGAKQKAYYEGWVSSSNIGSPASDDNYYIYTGASNGSTSQLYENGTLIVNNSGGLSGPNGIELNGVNNALEMSDCDFTDVFIFNTVLNTADRNTVENSTKNYYTTISTTPSITIAPNVTTTYTVTGTNAAGCAATASITVTVNPPNITPTFTAVAPIFCGASLAALPTTSNNGITGTWSPALNNTATTTYTFTPTAGQCATTATLTITVNPPNITPTFTAVAPICSGASLSALPTTSTNGITGTWSPALNNTATTTYTFTPTTGFCANIATMSIIV